MVDRYQHELQAAVVAIVEGARAQELESPTLEFKEPKDSRDDTIVDVVDAALCLANAAGGHVVLGVKNNVGGPEAFVGCEIEPDFFRRRLWELSRPGLAADIRLQVAEGAQLMVVRVAASATLHSDTKGRTPMRVGAACEPLSAEDVVRLRNERSGLDWSGERGGRPGADVSPESLAAARRLLRTLPDPRSELADLGNEDLLRALGVVDSEGWLLRAGELLLCEPPQSGVDAPGVLYQYRHTPGGEPVSIERLGPPFVTAFERVMELVQARQQLTPVTLPNGQQLQIEDFPSLAVREAVANAIIHRDYRLNSGSVSIEHSPEVMTISSPGPLVAGVTPENILTHPSKPRNPCLTTAARQLGLAEEVGRGVDRMYREMIRTGREVPGIDSSHDGVRVALVGGAPNTQMARYVALLPERERDDTDAMLILFTLRTKRTISAATAAPVLQKTDDESEAVLARLANDDVGMIEPTRETARRSRPTYRLRAEALQTLGAAVSYRRRSTDEIDRKVIEHVQEWNKITNRTVRNLLDVNTDRAAAILGSLVKRRILVKTSEAQRGPSVEYGPGAEFPKIRPGKNRRAPSAQDTLFKNDGATRGQHD